MDANGAGIPRATVAVFDLDWTWLREVTARATGRFTLSGLTPGSYRLQAGDSRPAWRTDRLAPRDATVRVRARQDSLRSLTLRRDAFVTGTVTRTRSDRPAARALVRATDEHGRTFDVSGTSTWQPRTVCPPSKVRSGRNLRLTLRLDQPR